MSPNSLQSEAVGLVVKLGSICRRLPYWVFATVVVLIGIAKIGPLGVGAEVISWFRSSSTTWPDPFNYTSGSLGPTLLMGVSGTPSDTAWWLGALVAWLATIGLLVARAKRYGLWGRLMVIAVAASPVFSGSLTLIGHYDLLLIWGSLLLVLSRRSLLLPLAIALAVLGNPQAALLAGVALAITATAIGDRRLILRGLELAAGALIVVVGVFLWFSLLGSSPERFSTVAQDALGLSTFRNFAGVWPLAIYALFGPLWLGVLVAWSRFSRGRLALALLGTLGIPLAATLITWDGTRTFIAGGLAALVALLAYSWSSRWSQFAVSDGLLGASMLLLIVMPTIIVDAGGLLRLPYGELLNLVGWEAVWQPK